jgi:hypothetical protein
VAESESGGEKGDVIEGKWKGRRIFFHSHIVSYRSEIRKSDMPDSNAAAHDNGFMQK